MVSSTPLNGSILIMMRWHCSVNGWFLRKNKNANCCTHSFFPLDFRFFQSESCETFFWLLNYDISCLFEILTWLLWLSNLLRTFKYDQFASNPALKSTNCKKCLLKTLKRTRKHQKDLTFQWFYFSFSGFRLFELKNWYDAKLSGHS